MGLFSRAGLLAPHPQQHCCIHSKIALAQRAGHSNEVPTERRRVILVNRGKCPRVSGCQATRGVDAGAPGPGSPVATTLDADTVNEHHTKCSKGFGVPRRVEVNPLALTTVRR